MKPLTYVIVHNGKGDFLFFEPRKEGYFFKPVNHNEGVIFYPQPQPMRGGEPCIPLPGGRPNDDYDAEGIIRAELNVDISAFRYHPVYHVEDFDKPCRGIYLCVFEHYDAFKKQAEENLHQAAEAIMYIRESGGRVTYNELMDMFKGCPANNTLQSVVSCNLFRDWDKIKPFNTAATNWIYCMFSALMAHTFPVHIYDNDDRLVAVGKKGELKEQGYVVSGLEFHSNMVQAGGQAYKITNNVKALVLNTLPGENGGEAIFGN